MTTVIILLAVLILAVGVLAARIEEVIASNARVIEAVRGQVSICLGKYEGDMTIIKSYLRRQR